MAQNPKHKIALPMLQVVQVPGKTTSVDRQRVLESMKSHLRLMPRRVQALKKADNDQLQGIMDDLCAFGLNNKELMSYVKVKKVGNDDYISVGEPNIAQAIALGLGAFLMGYGLASLVMDVKGCAEAASFYDPNPDEDDECERNPNCWH